MKAYPEYKDSGVAWIGMIPKHWEVNALKWCVNLGKNKTSEKRLPYVDLEHIESYTGKILPLGDAIPDSICNTFSKGDVLFCKLRPYLAKCVIAPFNGMCSSELLVLKDFIGIPRYLNYLLLAKDFIMLVDSSTYGSKMPRANWSFIGNCLIPLPPMEEQQAMAAYLDRVTAETDRAIGQQQRLIDLLTERKQIIIQRTVTRGLDPNATNVEWIPLRYVFEIRNGYTPSKKVSAYWTGGNIPWFRMEDIRKSGRILSDSIQHITSKAVKGKGLFKANSFILATTATIGEHALLIADSLANQRFTNLKICKSPSDRFDIKFLFYYMFVIGDWCKTSVNTTCFSSVDIGELKAQRIPLYPLSEQQAIAEYLDRATAKIDAAIARQQKMIDLLTERKQIIVSEVVTGRINVSNGEQINIVKNAGKAL